MNRRPLAVMAAAAAALILAGPLTPSRADVLKPGLVTYELTSTSDIPPANNDPLTHPTAGQTVPQLSFDMTSANALAPAPGPNDSSGNPTTLSPLSILNTTSGFDQTNGIVASGTKTVTNPDGSTTNLFGLSFFTPGSGPGLASVANGGHLDFTLRVDSTLPAPTFTLDPSSVYKGVQITEVTPPPTTTLPTPPATPTPPTTPTPTPTTTPSDTLTHNSGGSTVPGTTNTPEPMSLALWSVAGCACLAFRRRKAV